MPARALSPKLNFPTLAYMQDTGLLRASDERHWVNPSIINTSPGLLFSDWDLLNPLIIPVHQVDDSLGIINGCCFLARPPSHTCPSTPAIKTPGEKKGTPTKGGPHPAAPSQKGCSISSSFTLIKARALSFPFTHTARADAQDVFRA